MHQPRRLNSKIVPLATLERELRQRERQGQRIVFTNGCFDILHAGHVQLLEDARSLGDVLVVGVNSDSSVRGLKGLSRPVNPQEQRCAVLASLESVDFVVVFAEPDPLQVIAALRPHVLVKGGDWASDKIIGREVVEAAGGRVVSIPLMEGISTTDIIKRITAKNQSQHGGVGD